MSSHPYPNGSEFLEGGGVTEIGIEKEAGMEIREVFCGTRRRNRVFQPENQNGREGEEEEGEIETSICLPR